MASFTSLAKSLGHDVAALMAGKEIRTNLTVHNLAELKAALNPDGEILPLGAAAGLSGVIGEVTRYVYVGQALTPEAARRVELLFPLEVNAISANDKVLAPDEVWDLGTSTSPVTVNLGTLTMQPGSSVRIQNTVLQFTVETLCRNTWSSPPTQATGKITFTGAASNGDTVTINGVVITLVTSILFPLGNEILIGGSASATATNLQAFLAA